MLNFTSQNNKIKQAKTQSQHIQNKKMQLPQLAGKVTAFSVFGLNRYSRQNKNRMNGLGLTGELAAYRQWAHFHTAEVCLLNCAWHLCNISLAQHLSRKRQPSVSVSPVTLQNDSPPHKNSPWDHHHGWRTAWGLKTASNLVFYAQSTSTVISWQ